MEMWNFSGLSFHILGLSLLYSKWSWKWVFPACKCLGTLPGSESFKVKARY